MTAACERLDEIREGSVKVWIETYGRDMPWAEVRTTLCDGGDEALVTRMREVWLEARVAWAEKGGLLNWDDFLRDAIVELRGERPPADIVDDLKTLYWSDPGRLVRALDIVTAVIAVDGDEGASYWRRLYRLLEKQS